MNLALSMRKTLLTSAVAMTLSLSALPAQAEQFINVLTGGTSGVYYPLGVALAKIYGEKIPEVRTQVQATKASVENLNLLQQGKGEIALALGDSVKLAWEGTRMQVLKASWINYGVWRPSIQTISKLWRLKRRR
ncbi:TRAP transporter solute receptor, TAXI family [Thiothrix eikelboomii]|uniref:TRAP transporter solute receptor, TAXI family n=1 Tax=Thiothrix eikelboomii TaxID=92487 RepID=A0A1T4W1L4_9GAMM|nr:TRAP transporter solute receptor, TAXI family [Thiothrix eikelboomii]